MCSCTEQPVEREAVRRQGRRDGPDAGLRRVGRRVALRGLEPGHELLLPAAPGPEHARRHVRLRTEVNNFEK